MKRYIIIFALTLVCLLTACKKEPEKVELEYREYEQIKEYDTIFATGHSEKQGAVYVVTNEDSVALISLDKKYIYDISYKMHVQNYKGLKPQWGKRVDLDDCKICVYDMENQKILYEYDIKSLLEPYWTEYQLASNTLGTGIRQGKQVITLRLEKRPTDEEISLGVETEEIMFYLDVELGEMRLIQDEDNVEIIQYTYDSENLWMLLGTDILPDGIFADNYSRIEDCSYIQISTNKLPEHNKKLYGMFPELKEMKKEEGAYAYLFLSPKADNMEALSIILDDYEDVDFTKTSTGSNGFYGWYKATNGEIHRITENEYRQFQEEYWEYRKEQREEYGIEISNN